MSKFEDTETNGQLNVLEKSSAPTDKGSIRTTTQHQLAGGKLERWINQVSAINFSFILQCSWEAAAGTFQFALYNGGPASIVYGSIFAGVGTMLVAASLAEMASMDPTVGAQYRWSAAFAPRWNCFFGLIQGWITVFAWICSCTSNPALVSNVIIGLAQFNYPEYTPKRWHVTLIMWAITIFPFLGNFWFRKILTPLEAVGAFCHIAFFIASVATLGALAEKSSVDYVFRTLTTDISGWSNPVVAWGIGLLTVTYPLTGKLPSNPLTIVALSRSNEPPGFDGVLHMSDEVLKARTHVPRSMLTSVALNALLQTAFMLTLAFSIGDPALVTTSPLPIIQVYYQATGSKPATNVLVSMLGIVFFISFFNVYASDARLLWAFARDNGLPFSAAVARVNATWKMPVNALAVVGCCVTAFNALISLPALALYISYFLPIFFLFARRLFGARDVPIPWGPFWLGRLGPWVNLGAMAYIVFVVVWMPFPTVLPASGANMNYAGPLIGEAIQRAGSEEYCVSGRTIDGEATLVVSMHHVEVPRHLHDRNEKAGFQGTWSMISYLKLCGINQ
ncbi:hypothetical protein BS50DRAFT_585901 [Corynespora cassiicola Philippines]|uniref:Amino acid transporter n=1 Tax=Corynespora cassiicola Philippines TaxID=1448308 RepID=A0A2T2NYJ2_CORCC|nr:hypothetical protein BS50DRAFT_585901 [Corynespora cassiicola Philippines]